MSEQAAEQPQLTAVQKAMLAAKAAAATQAEAQATLQAQAAANPGAVATTSGNQVSVAVAPGPKMTMDSVAGGGMSVDAWFKVEKDGLRIGDGKAKFTGMPVILTMIDGIGFVVKKGIKGGNPAQYAYTQDEVTCTTGGTWEAACQRIRQLAGAAAATPYRCVDLPFLVPEDFEASFLPPGDKELSKETVAKAGQTLGLTTATTNWGAWEKFHREVAAAGLMGKRVLLEVGYEYRTNKAGNEWGTMTFKLIGDADEIRGE